MFSCFLQTGVSGALLSSGSICIMQLQEEQKGGSISSRGTRVLVGLLEKGTPGSGFLHPATHLEVFKDRRSELPRVMRAHSRACMGLGPDRVNGPGASKSS